MNINRLSKKQETIVNELKEIAVNTVMCTNLKNHTVFAKQYNTKLEVLKENIKDCVYLETDFQFNDKYFAYPFSVRAMNKDNKVVKLISLF